MNECKHPDLLQNVISITRLGRMMAGSIDFRVQVYCNACHQTREGNMHLYEN